MFCCVAQTAVLHCLGANRNNLYECPRCSVFGIKRCYLYLYAQLYLYLYANQSDMIFVKCLTPVPLTFNTTVIGKNDLPCPTHPDCSLEEGTGTFGDIERRVFAPNHIWSELRGHYACNQTEGKFLYYQSNWGDVRRFCPLIIFSSYLMSAGKNLC